MERGNLPGDRIPLWHWTPPSDPGYWVLSRSNVTHWYLGRLDPIGKDWQETGSGPGRSDYPDKGSGKISITLAVDGVQVTSNRSGLVRYSEQYPCWGALKDFWIVFPASTFASGWHTFTVTGSVGNLGLYLEESVDVLFEE